MLSYCPTPQISGAEGVRSICWCTPGMGVNLWGESPLYVNPASVLLDICTSTSRRQGRNREGPSGGSRSAKRMSRRTEIAYKAESLGKSARHDKAPGSGDMVNAMRLHRESSRSYPGRSAQRGHRVTSPGRASENAGWGYRLTKSRRYSGRVAPGIERRTNERQTRRGRGAPHESAS